MQGAFAEKKTGNIYIADIPVEGKSGVVFSGADEGEYINYNANEEIIILRGRIKMEFDGKTLLAQKIVYNRKTGDVTLTSDIIFDDGKNKIHADKCIYNVKENAGVLYSAKSIDEPMYFGTEKIRIVNKNTYITDKTGLTTCDLEKPHYHFQIKKLTVNKDGRAVGYNALYYVGDIPVFYFPVIVHSDDGIGIITQFGQGGRRGDYMQNTLKYTSEDGIKWKYKFDLYEKLGNYGGIEYNDQAGNSKTYAYVAGAKFRYADWTGSDWENRRPDKDENDNWFKAVLNNDYTFNKRSSSHTYSSIKFEWMNDWYFEHYYDARSEPENTFDMFSSGTQDIDESKYLYWVYTIGDKGANHDISLQLKRHWLWEETITIDDIDDYSLTGRYVPYIDQLPIFNFTYNDSFYFFGYNNGSGTSNKQKINWKFSLAGDSYKSYSQGDYYSTKYTPNGYLDINTDFIFLTLFTYTPGIRNGFVAQWVEGPFNDDESAKANAELAAEKKTYQFIETLNTLKFGLSDYYLRTTHYYRRSYLEKEVIEPFVHEKKNNFVGEIYLSPLSTINMSVKTSYDARSKYPFDEDRFKDIYINNSFFFDFSRIFFGKDSSSGKNNGLFYSGINLINKYIYITKEKTPGYNTLDIKYTTGNFSLPGIDKINEFEIGYNFFHDYRFPFRDTMGISWKISADLSRLWRLEIGGGSKADRAYLLYDSEDDENFFDEIKKSLYFYDEEKSENAVFNLQNFFVNVIHDLHCWEIGFFYSVQRKTESWGPQNKDSLIYYEQLFFVSLTLKAFSGKGFQKTQVYPLEQREEEEY